MAPKFNDQNYLKNDQYKDSSNLDARVAIHQEFSTNPYGWFNWLFDRLITLPAEAKILELGCGNGVLWKNIAGRIPEGWNITLSDFSAGMLDAAWRNLVVTGRAFKFEEIDAQSIPYAENMFDAVIANHMIYHVPDRQKAIQEMMRVLKPSGRLFATTVGENHLREMQGWRKRITHDQYNPFTTSFNLENGMEQLRLVFREVKLSRYEDNLQVNRVEPILAHMCSMVSTIDVDAAELEKLRVELEAKLAKDGKIFIAKDSGLFEAIK
ncbi:MAG: class I SAM-dependent methyltransferase [Chloroflexota bacterium]